MANYDTGPVEQLVYMTEHRSEEMGFRELNVHTTSITSNANNHTKNSFEQHKYCTDTLTLLSLVCSGVCLSECILMEQLLQSRGSHCQQYETDHKGALKRL